MNLSDRIGLVHPFSDIHTLGISYIQQLLEECGIKTFVSPENINKALDSISFPKNFFLFKKWVLENKLSYIGFSYRLDPGQALETFSRLIYHIDEDSDLLFEKGGILKGLFFAGLPESCKLVENKFGNRFLTFIGDETPYETLSKIGINNNLIPKSIQENTIYDTLRLDFGKQLINREIHNKITLNKSLSYHEYGTKNDHLVKRIQYAKNENQLPLLRVHSGPYLKEREKAILLFCQWSKELAKSGYLDILSIGSSQLTQSNFGEDWKDLPNGGGVPIQNENELKMIWESSRPLLLRAYSATKKIREFAEILERTINISWHALSFWWFNKIDGRGPLELKECIKEHCETLDFIAKTNKPLEPNVPHHFSFRGADDLAYIVSTFLAVKTAKTYGIKYLVLQNMLNTPKSTYGINDIAKARAILNLTSNLIDDNFVIYYQPRAGLDYFSPNLEKAKIQLAAVTALMMDIRENILPEIIHVVSYSEASHLATPEVINESLKITRATINEYSNFKKNNSINELTNSKEIKIKTEEYISDAKKMINHIEKNIKNTYSPNGLFNIYKAGYLPTPYIYNSRDEFNFAVNWSTKLINGEVKVVDKNNNPISIDKRLEIISNNLSNINHC